MNFELYIFLLEAVSNMFVAKYERVFYLAYKKNHDDQRYILLDFFKT